MKRIIALITVFIVFALFCTACGDQDNESMYLDDDPQIIAQYYKYVAYANAMNSAVSSYEEWKNSIKGEKGDKGDRGEKGEKGDDGVDGKNGADGTNGKDGQNGADGHSPVITIGRNGNWYIDGIDSGYTSYGQKGDKGDRGSDGVNGVDGTDGTDGVSIADVRITDEGVLEILYSDKEQYVALGKVKGENGKDGDGAGESSYELYKRYNPTYSKTEKEFVEEFFTLNRQGLEFYLQDDGSYAVSGGNAKLLTTVIIPEYYMGAKVTRILSNAFHDFDNLVNVVIPKTVEIVEAYSFNGCENLESIDISGSLTMARDCIVNCDKVVYNEYGNGYYLGNEDNEFLVLIKVDESAASVEVNDGCVCCVAEFGSILTSISIPSTLIYNDMLSHCKNLESLTLTGGSEEDLARLFGTVNVMTDYGPAEIANLPESLTDINYN